ncbi:MAG: ABC transporter permease [Opitutaceae bacterium]
MLSDLRLALRTLAKSPGFTAIAVLTLALGVGLSTSAFSLTNVLLFRTLPYPGSERLVRVFRTTPQSRQSSIAPGNALDIRVAITSFSQVGLYSYDALSFAEPDQPAVQLNAVNFSANFFNLLGVVPAHGRLFAPDEDQPGRSAVVVLTHRFWTRRFGSDPSVLGRVLRINGESATVIGVLPPTFEAPLVWGPCDIVRPLTQQTQFPNDRTNAWMNIVGRLKPGATIEQAHSELGGIARRLAQDFPKENSTDGLRAVSLHDSNMDSVSRMILWMMPILSTMVLCIACANLASLLIARAFGRTREFAVRAALGASRSQLMRPLLSESFLLALFGGVFGLLVAFWGAGLLGSNLRINNGEGLSIPIDGRVLAFAAISTLLGGLAFGLAPAWLASRTTAAESLKDGSRGSTSGHAHHRLKYTLVAAELAFTLVLVGVAGAFALGARGFVARDLGWNPEGLYSGFLVTPWNRYGEDEKLRTFHRELLERLAALPGVTHASIATNVPLFAYFGTANFTPEGQTFTPGQEPLATAIPVSADFFAAMGIPVRSGAVFPADLRADARPMIVVNEALARRFWPGENAVGKRLRMRDRDELAEIIAVVGDVQMAANLGAPPTRLQIYRPLVQFPPRYQAIILRSSVPPASISETVRRTVAALDPDLPVAGAGSVRDAIDRSLDNINLVIVNLAIFAGMGLLISVVGLYGVIAHLTAQRTRDIGVRIALGADYGAIVAMVLRQGTLLFALGMAVGLPAYLVVQRMLGRTMPEMPFPGYWLAAVILGVLGVATLIASFLPAHRAARTDPLVALRAE